MLNYDTAKTCKFQQISCIFVAVFGSIAKKNGNEKCTTTIIEKSTT